MAEEIDYVKSDVAAMRIEPESGKAYKIELLWGDRVVILGPGKTAAEAKVKVRGKTGFVKRSDLGGSPLLELYFIDVGQGDGVLIVTPDRKHLLIDGGWPRRSQPTGKNAADFVDWKFAKDYGMDRIDLDAVLCSHNDQDHYGGLWDLFNPEEEADLDIATKKVTAEAFYHAGLSWWSINGKRSLGAPVQTAAGKMFTRLVDSRASVVNALSASANPKLQGEWAEFLKCATKIKTRGGSAMPMKRLGHTAGHLPGFAPGENDVSIKVLAPVEFEVGGEPAIRYFSGGDSKNTNGNSLLLRLDFGRSRILLTGDLNTASMRSLLEDWAGQTLEFACDVAKGCHHGSDDVSYRFLATMNPAVTVISSGDAEGHDHPRPSIVAASATAGFLEIDKDELISPLIYSTELVRSAKLGKVKKLDVPTDDGTGRREIGEDDLYKVKATLAVTNAGQRKPEIKTRTLKGSRVVAGLVYGLVNVRTDGERILCATMNEAKHKWEVKVVRSRF